LSIEATVWALKFAPPMPPQLLGTLFGLADHADKRGRDAYPSVRTLAAYTCKSERSVQRDLKELGKLGLIRLGNQDSASHIPQERRPQVYDLVIPCARRPQDHRSDRPWGDADVRGDAHVTPRRPRHLWGDAHVRAG
jgi:hypothetical protein